jgi:hemerythrin-like domain-containing protein
LRRLIEHTREHFAVEERVLFGLAKELLGTERLAELGEEFARRRGLSRTV